MGRSMVLQRYWSLGIGKTAHENFCFAPVLHFSAILHTTHRLPVLLVDAFHHLGSVLPPHSHDLDGLLNLQFRPALCDA